MHFAITDYSLFAVGTIGAIDLIAATTNAFNGALLARSPSHYRHFTVAGIILLALAGGIGGGVLRDVLLNVVPAPLVNPWYLIFAIAAAYLALAINFNRGVEFRSGLLAFATSASLPWYAIVGAQKALDAHLGYVAAILIGVIGTTGGRYIIDISCGLVPKQFLRGEYFVLTAVLTTVLYIVLADMLGLGVIPSTIIAALFGFTFRLTALWRGWEEVLPHQPDEMLAGEKKRDTLKEDLANELQRTTP